MNRPITTSAGIRGQRRSAPILGTARLALRVPAVLMTLCAAAVAAQEVPPAIVHPVAPSAVQGVLCARPFTLEKPFAYTYLRDAPFVGGGHLLVVAVDPEAAKPRQVGMPVLYVGDTPAHLTNSGYPSGRLVVIVPDWVDPTGPVFYGSTLLPERVDRAHGARELALARARGARGAPPERWEAARAAGGAALWLTDAVALFRAAADLIERYAPEEPDPVAIYRTPLVGE